MSLGNIKSWDCHSESTQTETPLEHVCLFEECPHKRSDASNKTSKYDLSVGGKTSFNLAAEELRKKLEDLESRVPISIVDSVNEASISVAADEFPLIPSPLLNTPPYETIVLTEQNESKYRIYLNPKIHECFQKEVANFHEKLILNITNHTNNNEQIGSKKLCANSNNVSSLGSATSIVPCFDPSEVDLELKEIFKEHQPITHKIVRRRTRKDRGSSVPAIDSFYGTQDIEKVGHASYFIPFLTVSERKCVGWKPEYHYGKWKYKFPIVPNSTSGVLLHPKKSINPRGIARINIPYEGFCNIPDFGRLSACSSNQADSTEKRQTEDDSLSFITLSDSTHPSLTPLCQIFPDKQKLKKFVRWIVPCLFKDRVKATASQIINVEHIDEENRNIHDDCSNITNNIVVNKKLQQNDERDDKKEKHHNKHHLHFNIFGGHGKSTCSESSSVVTGGDILISNTASVSYDYDSPFSATIDTIAIESSNKSNLHIKQLDFSSDFLNTSLDSLATSHEVTVYTLDNVQLDKIETIDQRARNYRKTIMENKEAGIADTAAKNDDVVGSTSEDVYISREYMSDIYLEDENQPKNEFPYEDIVPPDIDSEIQMKETIINSMTINDIDTDEETSEDCPSVAKSKSVCRSQGEHNILTLSSMEHANIQTNNVSFSDDEDSPVIKLTKTCKKSDDVTVNFFETETFLENMPQNQYYKSGTITMKKEKKVFLQETRFLDPKDEVNCRYAESTSTSSSTSFENMSNKDESSVGTTLTNTSEEVTSDSEVENLSDILNLTIHGKKVTIGGIGPEKPKVYLNCNPESKLLKADDNPPQNTTDETIGETPKISSVNTEMDEEGNDVCPEDQDEKSKNYFYL